MATTLAPEKTVFDPIDVSLAELYTEDRWQEPFRKLRANAPIQYVPDSKFGPYWSVSTYKPIVHIEALPKIFSSSFEYGGISIAFYPDRLLPDEFRQPQFIAMDPPQHTAQRRTIAPAFGPSEVKTMQDEVRQRTAEVLDSLPIGEPFDWVEKLSIELTTGMLAKLFDFPWEERDKLTYWSNMLGDVELVHQEGGIARRNKIAMEMAGAFAELWQRKAAGEPGKDLISVMMQSDAMSEMSQEEFIGNLILLIVGGNDTTRNSMSAYAYGLSQFPEERAKLEVDPSLIPNAVSELIRWQTPLSHMRRTVMEDTEFEGVQMKKGDKVVLWYISANRDESVFDDPDSIRVDRENARRHLSFGYGIHRCVGARVAELQLHVLLEEMAKRRLRVDVLEEPERVPACFVHGYKKMMVKLENY
ncbi:MULTISPECIES: cytochrome P450 [unclassified Sphingorhabdus]|uniref:cytochrome P450 n=1 Tax=unclassified Sphingorhabdus TaxID=2614947 RepID=UPI000B5C2494|nr:MULTISPECIES: cytochrome P450 [unclassified Sphingorhabdus]ASK87197.1 linalool 8-monooxygenase [Sphingorhabdus sp. SMR4y]VWX62346.1 Linalool 8-monooxygenase [Sphingorhabdus sp. 109]